MSTNSRWGNDPEFRRKQRERQQTPEYKAWDRERKRRKRAEQPEAAVEYLREWRANNPDALDRYREHGREWHTNQSHPPLTYFIQSPRFPEQVTIGKTTNLPARMRQYAKCPVPLQLLGTTPIPEGAIHDYFREARISNEIFRYTPEMKQFIESECVMPQAGAFIEMDFDVHTPSHPLET